MRWWGEGGGRMIYGNKQKIKPIMFIVFSDYFNGTKMSINLADINYIEEYGADGAKFFMKQVSKNFYVKGSINEVADLINTQSHNFKLVVG